MARVDYPDVSSSEAQQTVELIKRERGGRFPHLFHLQMYNPAIVESWLGLGTAVRYKSELDAATRELAICLVARTTGAEYEWNAHRRIAAAEGFSDAQLEGILDWRNGDFEPKHKAVLALAEESTKKVDIADATFDAVRGYLSPRELVELMTTVAYYNMVARFLVGLRVDLEQ